MASDRIRNQDKKVSQFGLDYLLSVVGRLGIKQDIVRDTILSLCKIHYYEAQELHAMPEDDEITDEQRDRIGELNEDIEKQNELFSKLKQFVKLEVPEVKAPAEEDEENASGE